MKNLKILRFIAILAVIPLAFTTCSTDDSCACPNGTVHLAGETCCTYSDCTCETGVVGTRVEGIAVTNRNNVGNFNTAVNDFTNAFNFLSAGRQTYTRNNLREVCIISGSSNPPTVNSQNILIIEAGLMSDGDIYVALESWLESKGL